MEDKYILATREMMMWHYEKLYPYLNSKYNIVDCCHSSANMDKKSNSIGTFFFGDISKELEVELREFGFDVSYRNKKIKVSKW